MDITNTFFSGTSEALAKEVKEVIATPRNDIMLFVRLVNESNNKKKQTRMNKKSRLKRLYRKSI